jgi:hypothetical protein
MFDPWRAILLTFSVSLFLWERAEYADVNWVRRPRKSFKLRTALAVVGSIAIITHPLDDGLRRFYARWGFQDLPFDPRRAMIVRMVDLRGSFATLRKQNSPTDMAGGRATFLRRLMRIRAKTRA